MNGIYEFHKMELNNLHPSSLMSKCRFRLCTPHLHKKSILFHWCKSWNWRDVHSAISRLGDTDRMGNLRRHYCDSPRHCHRHRGWLHWPDQNDQSENRQSQTNQARVDQFCHRSRPELADQMNQCQWPYAHFERGQSRPGRRNLKKYFTNILKKF